MEYGILKALLVYCKVQLILSFTSKCTTTMKPNEFLVGLVKGQSENAHVFHKTSIFVFAMS